MDIKYLCKPLKFLLKTYAIYMQYVDTNLYEIFR